MVQHLLDNPDKRFQYHQSVIDHSKEAEKLQKGRPLAIALDTVRALP